MRGTNGPMDVITRAEFDGSMKDMLTREDLRAALASTSAEVGSIKSKLDDLKVDLLDSIETKIRQTKSSIAFQTVTKSDLDDAKNEILATTRRNISEAIAPLATKAELSEAIAPLVTKAELSEAIAPLVTKAELNEAIAPLATKTELESVKSDVAGLRSEMEHGFLKNAARLDAMEHKINTVVMDGFSSLRETITGFTTEMREVVKKHERMLDRHDADLYKLRQSGVLQ